MTARHDLRRARYRLRKANRPDLQNVITLGGPRCAGPNAPATPEWYLYRGGQKWEDVVDVAHILAPWFPGVCLECLVDPAYRSYYEGPPGGEPPACTHEDAP